MSFAPLLPVGLPDFQFRSATNSDAGAVSALIASVLLEYGLEADPGGTDADLADLEGSYLQSGGWFQVLTDGRGRIVGTVGLRGIDPGTVELRKMYLHAAVRNRGLGRFLLAQAIDQARARGFRRVILETATVLQEAVRLYERHGFRRVPESPHACRCDLVMELDLAQG
ncbi:MAG: GNAT family N-acetyltransferase [Limisphaerales bacterium]